MQQVVTRLKPINPILNPQTNNPQSEVSSGQNLSITFDTDTRIFTLVALVRDPKAKTSKAAEEQGQDDRPFVPNPNRRPVFVGSENAAYWA